MRWIVTRAGEKAHVVLTGSERTLCGLPLAGAAITPVVASASRQPPIVPQRLNRIPALREKIVFLLARE